MKPKRPRIRKTIKTDQVTESNTDYSEIFQLNAASKNAKFLCKFEESITLEFWIDKHYVNRKIFGDENGLRNDIEEKFLETLVEKSLKHLFYYSLKHPNFSFVNYPPPKTRNIRIVLKNEDVKRENLNIVVEYHFIEFHKYEVTVITAMRTNDFMLSDRQFSIEFNGDESFLMLHQNKKNTLIDNFY